MSRETFACLFSSTPISHCGQARAVEPVLASSWPLALIGLAILAMTGWAFLHSIYPRRIDWNRDRGPDWDVGTADRPTIEVRARRAGA